MKLYSKGAFEGHGDAGTAIRTPDCRGHANPVLMRDCHGELQRGTGHAKALRRAQLRMLHRPPSAHPFYWAAFIPAGDWQPPDARVFLLPRSTP